MVITNQSEDTEQSPRFCKPFSLTKYRLHAETCRVLRVLWSWGVSWSCAGDSADIWLGLHCLCDGHPKRGNLGIIASLAIGLIVGANILVGGPFDGAAMNPARAFGPALVGWRWHNHWIYWVGPLVGGGLAALIYEYLIIPTEPTQHHTHQPLAPEDY
ncbi:hypothetical protein SLEP1_g31511 [Rubroshorea leprosula]|uniref:Uncharacterized protein n=1 Tax=Rubroshorea leprosula TaxID=152421 RepID=A0AAV5KB43_9ROSI|nr:hypothetical protein SLEP1_g31511 [Rubroshorea leprosula]